MRAGLTQGGLPRWDRRIAAGLERMTRSEPRGIPHASSQRILHRARATGGILRAVRVPRQRARVDGFLTRRGPHAERYSRMQSGHRPPASDRAPARGARRERQGFEEMRGAETRRTLPPPPRRRRHRASINIEPSLPLSRHHRYRRSQSTLQAALERTTGPSSTSATPSKTHPRGKVLRAAVSRGPLAERGDACRGAGLSCREGRVEARGARRRAEHGSAMTPLPPPPGSARPGRRGAAAPTPRATPRTRSAATKTTPKRASAP